jgi:phage shock protein A
MSEITAIRSPTQQEMVEETKKATLPLYDRDQLLTKANELNLATQVFIEKATDRPNLEAPKEQIVELNNSLDEMEEFADQLLKNEPADDLFASNDLDIMREMLALFAAQRELKAENFSLFQTELDHQQKQEKQIRQQTFDLQKTISNRQKDSEKFGNMQVATAVVMTGLALFAFITGGASALITAGIACAGVAQGTSRFSKGILDHKNSKDTGKMFSLNEEREQMQKDMQDNLKEISAAIHSVMKTYSDLRKALNERQEALRAVR